MFPAEFQQGESVLSFISDPTWQLIFSKFISALARIANPDELRSNYFPESTSFIGAVRTIILFPFDG